MHSGIGPDDSGRDSSQFARAPSSGCSQLPCSMPDTLLSHCARLKPMCTFERAACWASHDTSAVNMVVPREVGMTRERNVVT